MTRPNRKFLLLLVCACFAACTTENASTQHAAGNTALGASTPLELLHEAEPSAENLRAAILLQLNSVQPAPGANALAAADLKTRFFSIEKTSEHIASENPSLRAGDQARIEYQFSMIETDATQEISFEGTVAADFIFDGARFNTADSLAVEDTRFGVTDIIEGSVTDCETGAALYKATIHILFLDGHEKRIFTDQKGQYIIRAVKGEQITVTAWQEGFEAEVIYTFVPDQVDFTLCAESAPDPVLPQVAVTVVDLEGHAVQGAVVSLEASGLPVNMGFSNVSGFQLFTSVPVTANTASASMAGKTTSTTIAFTSSHVEVSLTIPNHAPSCSLSAAGGDLYTGASRTISVLGLDSDHDALDFEFSTSGGAVSGASPELLYISSEVPGTYTVLARVSDGISLASCTLSLNVIPEPLPPAPSRMVSSVSGGVFHTCALTDHKQAWCWGGNGYGQLGNNTLLTSTLPVTVSSLTEVEQISTGAYHTCALTAGGAVKCWGMNTWGQLGNNLTSHSKVPVQVSGLTSGIREVALGSAFSCAVKDADGAVVCWGLNNAGQLGNNSYNSTAGSKIPVQVLNADLSPLTGIESITVAGDSACVIKAGAVICWGSNDMAQLNIQTATGPEHCDSLYYVRYCAKTAVATELTEGVATVTAGQFSYCALMNNGTVTCWGDNRASQLGHGVVLDICDIDGYAVISCAITARNVERVAGEQLVNVSSLMRGPANGFFCGLIAGEVTCWGGINYTHMGSAPSLYPTAMTLTTPGLSQLGAGYYHVCGITPDGKPECWGRNLEGELGVGDTSTYSSPKRTRGF